MSQTLPVSEPADYSSGPIGPDAYLEDKTPPSESAGPVSWVWVVEGKPAHVTGALWWAEDNTAGGFMPVAGEIEAAAEWQYHWQHYFNHPPSGSDGKPVDATPHNFYRGWKRVANGPMLQFGAEQQAPNSAAVANRVARGAPDEVPGTNNLGVG